MAGVISGWMMFRRAARSRKLLGQDATTCNNCIVFRGSDVRTCQAVGVLDMLLVHARTSFFGDVDVFSLESAMTICKIRPDGILGNKKALSSRQ